MNNVPRPVSISPCLNGYIVTVGCQTVVFKSREDLIFCLNEYLVDPDGTEKMYAQKALHKGMLPGQLNVNSIINQVQAIRAERDRNEVPKQAECYQPAPAQANPYAVQGQPIGLGPNL